MIGVITDGRMPPNGDDWFVEFEEAVMPIAKDFRFQVSVGVTPAVRAVEPVVR